MVISNSFQKLSLILHKYKEMENNDTVVNYSHSTNTWYKIRGTIVIVIAAGIICSNTINLIIWKRNKRLPSATRLFLLNLSTVDLLVGLVATAPAVYPAFTGHWPYGSVWCQISGVVHGSSVTLSIWSIAMVGIDRYIAVLKPHSYKQLMSRTRSLTLVACMWVAAFVTFMAPIFTKSNFVYYQYSSAEAFCGLYWESPIYCIVTGLYIPIGSAVILLFTSIKVYQNILSNRRSQVPSSNSPTDDQTERLRPGRKMDAINQRALVILVAAAAFYFIFWGPYVIATVLNNIFPKIHLSDTVKFILMWIANANSMVNVFIYSLTNKSFLKQAGELFRIDMPAFDNLIVIGTGSENDVKRNCLKVTTSAENRV